MKANSNSKSLARQRSASLRDASRHLAKIGRPGMTRVGDHVALTMAAEALAAAIDLDEQIRGRWASSRGTGSKEAVA